MTQAESQADRANSLPAYLAARARAASDTRLAVDAIAGLLVVVTFNFWHVPGWYLLVAVGACFLFYGTWAIANRELVETPLGSRNRSMLRALAAMSAAMGIGAALFLALAVLAKVIGPVIS